MHCTFASRNSAPFFFAITVGLAGCGKDNNPQGAPGAQTNPAATNSGTLAASGVPSASSSVSSPTPVPSQEKPSGKGAESPNWDAAKEVLVRGSDAVSCETKVLGATFRMVCRPNEKTGKVVSANSVRGFDAAKGELAVQAGVLTFTTPYERGTDVVVTIFGSVRLVGSC